MSKSVSFRQAMSRVLPMVKVVGSVLLLALGLRLHLYGDLLPHDSYGLKAALLASVAAAALFYELLPNGRENLFTRIAPWSTRFAGGVLASFAAWNWVLGETNGEPFPLIWPIVAMVIVVVTIPVLSLASDVVGWWAYRDTT